MISSIPAPMPIEAQLREIHASLRSELPAVARIAIATYDGKTDLLSTFAHSTDGEVPFGHYEMRLAQVPSLGELARTRRDRVMPDLSILEQAPSPHSRAIAARYGSSYTRPLVEDGRLRGFIFYDAVEKEYFTPAVVQRLTVYSELVQVLLANSLFPARMIKSVAYVAQELSHSRDPETGAHLDRMSRYARIIALRIAPEHGLSDSFIEHLFAFAPLHDVGKVGIPDRILLKRGRLDDAEMAIMRTHVTKGAEMVDRLLGALGVSALPSAGLLRNVILHHHEAWDGTGYPDRLIAHAIPIEARIVTVADVFDALTSERPYKVAWPFDDALAYMRTNAGRLFDADCVTALEAERAEVQVIHDRFRDEPEAIRLREGYAPDL